VFTGIITDVGTIRRAEQRGDLRLMIGCGYDPATIDLGASIACSGACLTVVDKGSDGNGGWFAVDLSAETVACTAAGLWREGARLNLERALRVGDELGGHIVAGHVDAVARLVAVEAEGDSTRWTLEAPDQVARALAPKGSVTLDGVSLTVNQVEDRADGVRFGVNLIPHTAAHTTLGDGGVGRELNLEIDLLSRYLERMLAARGM
jgi:riboflavin synthase